MALWSRLIVGSDGQDLIEYALLATLIALAVLGAVMTFGQAVQQFWTDRIVTPMSGG